MDEPERCLLFLFFEKEKNFFFFLDCLCLLPRDTSSSHILSTLIAKLYPAIGTVIVFHATNVHPLVTKKK